MDNEDAPFTNVNYRYPIRSRKPSSSNCAICSWQTAFFSLFVVFVVHIIFPPPHKQDIQPNFGLTHFNQTIQPNPSLIRVVHDLLKSSEAAKANAFKHNQLELDEIANVLKKLHENKVELTQIEKRMKNFDGKQPEKNLEEALMISTEKWNDRPIELQDLPESFRFCKKLYIDLGSNFACVQCRKFFQPELYPNAPIIPFFDKFFGTNRQQRENCVLGFEGNTQHVWNLQRVESCYRRQGWNLKLFAPSAVSNITGEQIAFVFNATEDSDKGHHNWGAGMQGLSPQSQANPAAVLQPVLTIDIVPILKFFEYTDFVFVKMDIEGAETIVLHHWIKEEVLCTNFINKMIVEWHFKWGVIPFELNRTGVCEAQKAKTTQTIHFDDEMYADDGKLLPCEVSQET